MLLPLRHNGASILLRHFVLHKLGSGFATSSDSELGRRRSARERGFVEEERVGVHLSNLDLFDVICRSAYGIQQFRD
jgi:hypothetical protein